MNNEKTRIWDERRKNKVNLSKHCNWYKENDRGCPNNLQNNDNILFENLRTCQEGLKLPAKPYKGEYICLNNIQNNGNNPFKNFRQRF